MYRGYAKAWAVAKLLHWSALEFHWKKGTETARYNNTIWYSWDWPAVPIFKERCISPPVLLLDCALTTRTSQARFLLDCGSAPLRKNNIWPWRRCCGSVGPVDHEFKRSGAKSNRRQILHHPKEVRPSSNMFQTLSGARLMPSCSSALAGLRQHRSKLYGNPSSQLNL